MMLSYLIPSLILRFSEVHIAYSFIILLQPILTIDFGIQDHNIKSFIVGKVSTITTVFVFLSAFFSDILLKNVSKVLKLGIFLVIFSLFLIHKGIFHNSQGLKNFISLIYINAIGISCLKVVLSKISYDLGKNNHLLLNGNKATFLVSILANCAVLASIFISNYFYFNYGFKTLFLYLLIVGIVSSSIFYWKNILEKIRLISKKSLLNFLKKRFFLVFSDANYILSQKESKIIRFLESFKDKNNIFIVKRKIKREVNVLFLVIKKIRKIFLFSIPLIAYHQKYTIWQIQGYMMDLDFFGYKIIPNKMLMFCIFTAIFILILRMLRKKISTEENIEIMSKFSIYSCIGVFFALLVQLAIEYNSSKISILFQIPQYIFITISDVTLFGYGISYCYMRRSRYRTIFGSMWYLALSIGAFFATTLNKLLINSIMNHNVFLISFIILTIFYILVNKTKINNCEK